MKFKAGLQIKQVNPNLVYILHYAFKSLPFILGGLMIWLGYRLFLFGVGGTASLVVNAKDFSGQLLNASPGIFLIVCGTVVVGISVWRGAKTGFSDSDSGTVFFANTDDKIEDTDATPERKNDSSKPK